VRSLLDCIRNRCVEEVPREIQAQKQHASAGEPLGLTILRAGPSETFALIS
jgi:hypothetical protein